MNIKIIINARHIPDGVSVCKPTGSKIYKMRRKGIAIFTAAGTKVFGAGDLHIQCEDHIQTVLPGDMLAVDFDDADVASDFLRDELEGVR